MLEILKNGLNQLGDDSHVFEIIKDKYIPQIYEAVLEVVKSYDSHISFGSKKF